VDAPIADIEEGLVTYLRDTARVVSIDGRRNRDDGALMNQVRQFEDADASALATLMLEMVAFYGRPLAVQGDLESDIVRQAKDIKIVVAFADGRLSGFATYGFLYPVAGLQSFAYLQQIYVAASARRRGIAEDIMAFIAARCLDHGCNWMEWSTGADNLPARNFYEGLGANPSEKIMFEISDSSLKALAERRKSQC